MVEAIPGIGAGYHAAIYGTRSKRIPPSLYWGLMFALLLHAGLAWYIFHQSFSGPIEAMPSEGPPIIMTMDKPEPPKPQPQPPAKTQPVIVTHTPATQAPATVETLAVDTSKPASQTVVGPPATFNPASGNADTSVSTEPTYAEAKWTRFPDGNALTQYYPQRATDDEMEGVATVECLVLDNAGRVSCATLSETPGGYGFGKATVRMVQDKGRIDTSAGQVKVGSKLRVTVSWKLGN